MGTTRDVHPRTGDYYYLRSNNTLSVHDIILYSVHNQKKKHEITARNSYRGNEKCFFFVNKEKTKIIVMTVLGQFHNLTLRIRVSGQIYLTGLL